MLKEKIEERIQAVKSEYTNRKNEREREKERLRRKKGQRKFGQAALKHSTMGVHSLEYAGGSAAILLLCIVISFLSEGKAGGFIGGLGIIAFVLAVRGVLASIKGRREREKNYITCKIGSVCNGLLVLGMGIIFIGGFF